MWNDYSGHVSALLQVQSSMHLPVASCHKELHLCRPFRSLDSQEIRLLLLHRKEYFTNNGFASGAFSNCALPQCVQCFLREICYRKIIMELETLLAWQHKYLAHWNIFTACGCMPTIKNQVESIKWYSTINLTSTGAIEQGSTHHLWSECNKREWDQYAIATHYCSNFPREYVIANNAWT